MKWMLEAGVQEFFKCFNVPAVVTEVEWHRAVREFFVPIEREDSMTTHFVRADEAETAVANLFFGDMVDMSVCVDAQPKSLMLAGHFANSVDSLDCPQTWSQGEGQNVIERFGTPEAVVGYLSRGDAYKAKRPIAAICKYLTLMIDEILDKFPPGEVPPIDEFTFRSREEIEPCLKKPMSEGWKSIHDMSIMEALVVIYYKHMRINVTNPKKEGRDRFVLSKRHAGPALSFFPLEWLDTLNCSGTNLPSHADMNRTPGVDMTTGSLGQGFSCAVGIALGSRLREYGAKIYAIIGLRCQMI